MSDFSQTQSVRRDRRNFEPTSSATASEVGKDKLRDDLRHSLRLFDAVIASTSLHHVADPAEVLDRVATILVGTGTLIVVEWAWEDFDEATADWCFERLGTDEEAGWLHRRRDEWFESGQSWSAYVRAWAEDERLHSGSTLLRLLDERFQRERLARGPYFFPDLTRATESDERAAIEAGQIRATRVDYVGTLR